MYEWFVGHMGVAWVPVYGMLLYITLMSFVGFFPDRLLVVMVTTKPAVLRWWRCAVPVVVAVVVGGGGGGHLTMVRWGHTQGCPTHAARSSSILCVSVFVCVMF